MLQLGTRISDCFAVLTSSGMCIPSNLEVATSVRALAHVSPNKISIDRTRNTLAAVTWQTHHSGSSTRPRSPVHVDTGPSGTEHSKSDEVAKNETLYKQKTIRNSCSCWHEPKVARGTSECSSVSVMVAGEQNLEGHGNIQWPRNIHGW